LSKSSVQYFRLKSEIDKSGVVVRLNELITGPLYGRVDYSDHELGLLESGLIMAGVVVDLFCSGCKRESTFRSDQMPANSAHQFRLASMAEKSSAEDVSEHLAALTLYCSRDPSHRVEFIIRKTFWQQQSKDDALKSVFGPRLIKIGQYPTYADFQIPEFKHLQSELSPLDRSELAKAVGLAAHDSTIGAFVYLRRVFERLIDEAQAAARKSAVWDEGTYQESRMDERVQLLKEHLPDVLVENRKIYRALSLGIHRLTDEFCAELFPVIKDGIYVILEDRHAKKRQETIRKEYKPALDSIIEKIDKAEKGDSVD
jgi:hypothetical protein